MSIWTAHYLAHTTNVAPVANILMLGFLAVSNLVSHNAVRASVPEGAKDLNISALDKGYD